MIRITDQYFWNFVLLAFFAFLVTMATIILETESRLGFGDIGLFDISLVVLSTWRAVRLFSSDSTTKFFREQFYDLKKTARTYSLEVPAAGPRRTVLDILLNPWHLSLGLGGIITFFYLLTSYAVYPLALLALSGIVAFLEMVTDFLSSKSDKV